MWNGTAQLLMSAVNQCPDPWAGPSRDERLRRTTDKRKKVVCCSSFRCYFSILAHQLWLAWLNKRSKLVLNISLPTHQVNSCTTFLNKLTNSYFPPILAKSLYPQEIVYLNKRCYPGPLLSRDLMRSLPDAVRGSVVGPEKHNIMRLCMQHLVSASINPKQVLELFSREFYQSKKNR